jgi:outer membrane lipopolysaccharide assembly protein LptE/RlpB
MTNVRVSSLQGLLISALTLSLAACGYHTAGHSRLPTTVQTIAIPAFINKTSTYRVEQVLTEAVAREFISRTKYRVVNQETSDADAVLRGTVISSTISPLTYDSTTGRASSALVTIIVRVQLVDRKGKVLFENPSYSFTEQYQISREVSSFFQEESPALDRLSRDFARTLVSNVLEAW